jgi:hypothetical protein
VLKLDRAQLSGADKCRKVWPQQLLSSKGFSQLEVDATGRYPVYSLPVSKVRAKLPATLTHVTVRAHGSWLLEWLHMLPVLPGLQSCTLLRADYEESHKDDVSHMRKCEEASMDDVGHTHRLCMHATSWALASMSTVCDGGHHHPAHASIGHRLNLRQYYAAFLLLTWQRASCPLAPISAR